MHRNPAFEDVDDHSMTVIKHKARELVGHYGFTISDVEDVEQDLRIHVAQKLLEYDSMRGAKSTYVGTVTKRKTASIIKEERQSGKYDHRLIGRSLDEHVVADHEDGLLLGETLSWDSIRLGNGGLRRTSAEQSDMRIELGRAMSALTPEERELCIRLAQSSIVDIIRETGMPRHKIQWMRKRIKRVFLRFCLDEYL